MLIDSNWHILSSSHKWPSRLESWLVLSVSLTFSPPALIALAICSLAVTLDEISKRSC